MIVKLVVREKDISIWNKDGERLYFSDQQKDIDYAKNLGEGHFNAYWRNKIVILTKRASGYTW